MSGGLFKTASALALIAAAGLYGIAPAKAADLGGDCCADLEERVAELEATTVRKGNRKVSLSISGQVSQQLMYWDDGIRSDVYVNGPTASNSRWRFTGNAKISPEVTAGFLYEFEAYASSTGVNQGNGSHSSLGSGTGDDVGATGGSLREAMVWLQHKTLGKVQIGHGSTAANNIILVDLSGKGMAAPNDVRLVSSGFRLAMNDGTYHPTATWGNFFQGGSGDWLNERVEHIAYFTPTVAGFTAGVSWGEDNYWDAALRYAGEFNGIRIAGGIGYSVRSEYNAPAGLIQAPTQCTQNCEKELRQLAGSLSIRHMPTGLFFTGAAGRREMENHQFVAAGPARDFESNFFYVSGGFAKNVTGLGDTVLYGEYSEWRGAAQDVFADITDDDKLTHWGVGIVQHVDAAAMEFWLAYKNYGLSGPVVDATNGGVQDLHLITAGTRIRF